MESGRKIAGRRRERERERERERLITGREGNEIEGVRKRHM